MMHTRVLHPSRNILTLLETCTKEGPLLGLNFFISHDRPPRNTCWGLFYHTCEFLDKPCSFKGSRRDFLRSISGRVHISTRVKDSILAWFRYLLWFRRFRSLNHTDLQIQTMLPTFLRYCAKQYELEVLRFKLC